MNTIPVTDNSIVDILPVKGNKAVFGFLWLLTFVLYLPAAKAGWVIDAAGWLYNIRHLGFLDYINNAQSGIPSLYQFTQFTTWIFYKLFNANPYAWHLLMVTMHAVNAFLVFIICRRLFYLSGIRQATNIALAGVVLYTICPHISEVIVWEASYHYLQGFMIILFVLLWVQHFHEQQLVKYAWWAGIIYLLSTYSLEIFYLTPWFVLALAAYYRLGLQYDKAIFRKVIRLFFIPQVIMFGLHLLVLRIVYGHFAHIAENVIQPVSSYFCKPPKYVFNILFLGRYFPNDIRQKVYGICESLSGMLAFYIVVLAVCYYLVSRFSIMGAKGKAGVLLFTWMVISIVILMPLGFPQILLMFYDRYTYLLDAFTYMLLALLVSNISVRFVQVLLFSGYGFANLFFTIKLNLYWKYSTYIDNRLLRELPDAGKKTVILLSMPENMNGIAMIGAQPDGEYKAMHELFIGTPLPGKVYDAASFNMVSRYDGANVKVLNDSTLQVTLNQWGTWWWYEGHGGKSYETSDYRLDMKDVGHWYEITLKKPSEQYLLLFSVGDKWKTVDMSKRNEAQY